MREEEIRAEHFREAEASFKLEGLDAADNENYQSMKSRVIAGEIDADEAIRQTVEHYKALSGASLAEYAIAK